jgi:hypothetical protein
VQAEANALSMQLGMVTTYMAMNNNIPKDTMDEIFRRAVVKKHMLQNTFRCHPGHHIILLALVGLLEILGMHFQVCHCVLPNSPRSATQEAMTDEWYEKYTAKLPDELKPEP